MLGRFGGDEFVITSATSLDVVTLGSVAERIAEVGRRRSPTCFGLAVTASIGVRPEPVEGDTTR